MIRLFLKLYGVLIAALVFSFVLQMKLLDYVWSEMSSGFDFRVRFRPTFLLIEQALAPYAPDDWPMRYQSISAAFPMASRLEPAERTEEAARFRPEQAKAFAQGSIVSLEHEGGGFTLVKRLRDSPYAVAIDFPGPDAARVRLVTYVVNWSVEGVIVAVLVFFWVRPFWRDLKRLRQATGEIGSGEFEARVEVGKLSALKPLAAAVNAMAMQIGALMQSHRTLTSAVSHELRTPIARLRFSHSLAREDATPEQRERYLARMERDIAEIDALTRELLDYARLERGVPRIALENVPAEPWLEDVLADAHEDRPSVEMRADVEVPEVRCEPRYMARAVVNLLRNAALHARSKVAVCVRHEDGRTVIHVDDDGSGISGADRERLFEPFVRLDQSRGRDSGGFGLGLAIVRQVARWHGGDAYITDSPLGGARVSIAW
jgi:signal transduction histidine kinase